jgi:NAD(P)-dependent dehydrogenase (short-subunit alcohol dehydrogenase family)
MRFEHKTVIVTGGGRGIGRRIAALFHREGANVVIADTSSEGADAAAALDHTTRTACFVHTDVSRSSDIERLVDETTRRHERIDVVVSNAGIMRNIATTDSSDEDWHRVIDVCLSANFYLARHAGPELMKGGGSMICIASIHALQGAAGWAAYEAAKGGIIALVRSLAAEFGPKRVRVNAVSPGWILAPEKQAAHPDLHRRYGYHQMLRRAGLSDEVATAVLFLASEDAAFITGHNLRRGYLRMALRGAAARNLQHLCPSGSMKVAAARQLISLRGKAERNPLAGEEM